MTKKPTYRELADIVFKWRLIAVILFVGIIPILILLQVQGITYWKVQELKQQLQSCHEQVEVWTLKVECYFIDEESIYHYFEINLINYEDYLNRIELIENIENCEVLK